jgi:hypothetical protein
MRWVLNSSSEFAEVADLLVAMIQMDLCVAEERDLLYRKDFLKSIETFINRPCQETAQGLFELAPNLKVLFEHKFDSIPFTPLQNLGRTILREILKCADMILSDEVPDQSLAGHIAHELVIELCCLYLHLVIRAAFDMFGNEFRVQFQSQFITECLDFYIDILYFPASNRNELIETFMRKLNATKEIYGQKQSVVGENFFSSNSVIPTFACRVADILEHPKNPITILRIRLCLVNSLFRLHLNKLIQDFRCEINFRSATST